MPNNLLQWTAVSRLFLGHQVLLAAATELGVRRRKNTPNTLYPENAVRTIKYLMNNKVNGKAIVLKGTGTIDSEGTMSISATIPLCQHRLRPPVGGTNSR